MASSNTDPIIRDFREQISTIDLKIVEAINTRIDLVMRLKDHKEAHGLTFYDATQEERVLALVCQANHGPVSNEGLRDLYGFLLEWAKREVTRLGGAKAK